MDEQEYQKILEVKRAIEDGLLAIPGVHGVSIGSKRVGGQPTDRMAIAVHLTKKRPLEEIAENERILPEYQSIPTDIMEHEQPTAHASL